MLQPDETSFFISRHPRTICTDKYLSCTPHNDGIATPNNQHPTQQHIFNATQRNATNTEQRRNNTIHHTNIPFLAAYLLSTLSTTNPINNQPNTMSRGDQRVRDRAKREAKEASKTGGKQREGTVQQRNQDDKEALLVKLEAKKAQKAAGASAEDTKKPVARKKVEKQADDLFSLLNAGLKQGKK
jgi:hypothetical protein